MRTWLLSNTTYGTWLPGDERGSVTSVRDRRPGDPVTPFRFVHNMPGEPWEDPMPALRRAAMEQMTGPPIFLTLQHAEGMLEQYLETAAHRGRRLLAVAIMFNHYHLVVEVPGDPCPDRVLSDFKAYASRKLNESFGRPASETWWTGRGSKRKLPNDRAVAAAIDYVLYRQPNPLLVWSEQLGRLV